MDLYPVVLLGGNRHFAIRHLFQNLVKLSGGHGDATCLQHIGLVMPADADLQIGGHELNAVLLRLEQNVREDGHGIALLHNALDPLKPGQQLIPGNPDLHGQSPR